MSHSKSNTDEDLDKCQNVDKNDFKMSQMSLLKDIRLSPVAHGP